MSLLLSGDCLEQLSNVDDDSVDFIFCDLPYGQTACKWDSIIPWKPFWNEIMRVKKINTPIFFTTTTKFGVDIINNAPKKCPFRYDLVWVKSASTGFLSAKKMPMRKHELIYVFYEKLPFYDLSSHKHKFIQEYNDYDNKDGAYGVIKSQKGHPEPLYNPPLPVSVVKIVKRTDKGCNGLYGEEKNKVFIYDEKGKLRGREPLYEPPLPNSLLEIKSSRGKHSTEKPVALIEWLLKYYSKEGDVVLDATMGSGSTGVACKNMKRNFIGIEKDPEIFEVAVNRIQS